jgi:hypothetical protein
MLYHGPMRKILLVMLMLLTVTPGMVCAMPLCAHHSEKSPCPHHQGKGAHGVMLHQDCAKTDLQTASGFNLQKPDFAKTPVIAPADSFQVSAFDPGQSGSIRGPPPEWPDPSLTKPSIILSTLRFRE